MTFDGPIALFEWFANWFEQRNLTPQVEVTLRSSEFLSLWKDSRFQQLFVMESKKMGGPYRERGDRRYAGTLAVGGKVFVEFYVSDPLPPRMEER